MPTLRHKVEYSSNGMDQTLYRLLEASHCHTCQHLADFFEVSLSFARQTVKKIQDTGAVPDSWLVLLNRMHNICPEWVLTGCGPRFMYINPEGHYEPHDAFIARQQEREVLRGLSIDALLYEIKRRSTMACNTEKS